MSLASVIIVTACLIIFGTYLVFGLNLNYIGEQFKSQFEIRVYIELDTPENRIAQIGKQLESLENVNKVTYISKKDAFREAQDIFKDMPEALLGYEEDGRNPLSASYKLTMKELANVDALTEQIEKIPGVKNVENHKSTMENMLKTTNIVQQVSLLLMILLAIISVLIISNAIKITVFARRKDINIMKVIGATDNFIRIPFVIEGIMIGLTGAVLATIIILPSYGCFIDFIRSLLRDMLLLKAVNDLFGIITGSFLFIGILLGAVGSAIAVKKHLKV